MSRLGHMGPGYGGRTSHRLRRLTQKLSGADKDLLNCPRPDQRHIYIKAFTSRDFIRESHTQWPPACQEPLSSHHLLSLSPRQCYIQVFEQGVVCC